MHSLRLLRLAAMALSAAVVARAGWLLPEALPRDAVAVRDVLNALTNDATSDTTTSDSSTDSPTTTTTSKTTSVKPTTTDSTTQDSPTTTAPTSSDDQPTSTKANPPPASSTASDQSSASSASHAKSTASSAKPSTVTIVATTTNADGSVSSFTTESTSTPTATLSSDSTSSQSGMSPQTRNTVIGVVVGVGGAILLAAGALVGYRIWGRKRATDETDGLMTYGAGPTAPYSPPTDKPETSGPNAGRTPFQSTLESYHAPTQVNAASNF